MVKTKKITQTNYSFVRSKQASRPKVLPSESLRWSANQVTCILSSTSSDTGEAWLLAASSPHTGDWLHAPPIASVGLRLSDEAVRVAVAHRLGCKACEPRTCVCGKAAVHGVSMAWHVAEVAQDNSLTANSTTSYGGHSREHKFQL